MANSVLMKSGKTGILKDGFYGFSWTYTFFGFWVPLFRGNMSLFAYHFLFAAVCISSFYTMFDLMGVCIIYIPQIIMAFFFNKLYTIDLFERGYTFVENDEAKIRAACVALDIPR